MTSGYPNATAEEVGSRIVSGRAYTARCRLAACIAAVAMLACAAPAAQATEAEAAIPPVFAADLGSAHLPIPSTMRTQINFWKDIFGTYSEFQVVIHDTEDLGRVYSVLDFRRYRDSGLTRAELEPLIKDQITDEKERVRAKLVSVHNALADGEKLSKSDEKIARLFRRDGDEMLRAAAPERVRAQYGLRERFSRGIAVSHRYLPEIESIFRQEGVPVAVTRLPLVESCFDVEAYSKVGAAGVWQFMPSTGRLYMRIDDAVDERRDPVIAARAAARFLRTSYEKLGAWPLAITGYNHGPGGVARAVNELGTTDIGVIVQQYHGPAFGFASRNFYAELVAAVEVETELRRFFPDLELQRPRRTEWLQLPRHLGVQMASELAGLDVDELLELNPALTPDVRRGRYAIPANYPLRVPPGRASGARERCAQLPPPKVAAKSKVARAGGAGRASRSYKVHKVSKGQTLSQIAERYGTSVNALKKTNGLKTSVVRAGQALRIPEG